MRALEYIFVNMGREILKVGWDKQEWKMWEKGGGVSWMQINQN